MLGGEEGQVNARKLSAETAEDCARATGKPRHNDPKVGLPTNVTSRFWHCECNGDLSTVDLPTSSVLRKTLRVFEQIDNVVNDIVNFAAANDALSLERKYPLFWVTVRAVTPFRRSSSIFGGNGRGPEEKYGS
jgi:hypothetical protein